MLTFPVTVKIFVCTRATDMRRSFDGLCAVAASVVQEDPLSGHFFVFRNKSGDRIKVLYWDRDGLCIWYKRLEKGTFELPAAATESVEISASELSMLIDGIALNAQRRRRFTLTPS